MIIDCIGCLHGARPQLDGGDLLIVTGDLTVHDRPEDLIIFISWLSGQRYDCIVLVAGNHDNHLIGCSILKSKQIPLIYLCDSGTEHQGLKIWGSPWTAAFKGINPKCTAFTVPVSPDQEDKLMDKWNLIPHDTDILITHTPAYGMLDGIPLEDGSLFHAGSKSLYAWLKYVERPRLHVFSHIHEGYGKTEHFPSREDKMMISVNCSIMNGKYKPVNKPVRIVL